MARNKEALVLLLDVGPSMHGVLQEVENICSTLVHKKLVYNRSDEIGVVLFGTKGIVASKCLTKILFALQMFCVVFY
jgi:hypothetical protein